MNKFFIILSCFCLTLTSAFAEDEKIVDMSQSEGETIDIEAVAANSTMMTAQEYLDMTRPIRQEAHRQAKIITKQEAKALMDAQNYVNRRVAEKNNEEIPEEINIDPTDPEAVEDLLTPKHLYTYDDLPIKLEYNDFK